jgi:hypothetical protein
MCAAIGMEICGPPCAVAGAVAGPEIAKDPVGFVGKVVDCVFGGNCGNTVADIEDAITKPAPSLDQMRRLMHSSK